MISRAREWALRLLLIAGSAVLTLVLLEAWLRSRELPPDHGSLLRAHPVSTRLVRMQPDTTARFTGVPVRVNRYGYRGADWSREKPPGVFRIVMLGDSQTLGYGVEEKDTYPVLVERRLRELRPDRAWEALNISQIGFNTVQEAEACTLDALPFDPDLVVVGFFPNDLDPPIRPSDIDGPSAGGGDRARNAPSPRRWIGPLRAPQFFKTRGAALARRLGLRIATTTSRTAELFASRGPAWRACEDALRSMRDACRRRGARFAVVILPFIVSLDATHPMAAAHRQVAALCRAAGIPCLDLLPAFLGKPAERFCVSPVNNHMNAEGSRIAAEAIVAWLLESGLAAPAAADSGASAP